MNCDSRWVARLPAINHRYAGVTDDSGLRTNPYWQENLPTDSDGKGFHFHVLHHRSCMEGKSLTWFMKMVTCGRNLRAALLSFGEDCRPRCKCKMELTRIVRRDAISYVGSIETCSVWPQQGDEHEIVHRWELDESVNAATRVGKALLLCTLGDWRRLPAHSKNSLRPSRQGQ